MLATLWWFFHGGSKTSFRTAVIRRGDVAATISASGTIEPVEVVDIGAQVAGIIKSFGTDINGKTIDYGSTVEEGAVLAKIDDSVYAADLSVAKAGELSATANLEQMQAKLDQAEAEWKRAQQLYSSKLLAGVDYDTDKANYESPRQMSRSPVPASRKHRPIWRRRNGIWISVSSNRQSEESSLTVV